MTRVVVLLSALLLASRLTSSLAATTGSPKDVWIKFWSRPSIAQLPALRVACGDESPLNFDGDTALGNFLKVSEVGPETAPGVARARALVIALEHCTDGASRLAVKQFVGAELWLARAGLLVKALAAERAAKSLAPALAAMQPESIFLMDNADPKVAKIWREALHAKRKAMESLHVKGAEAAARDSLLQAVKALQSATR